MNRFVSGEENLKKAFVNFSKDIPQFVDKSSDTMLHNEFMEVFKIM